MMAHMAYLTTPAPGVFVLNVKRVGEEIERIEISQAQLANIVVDGAAMALTQPERGKK